MNTIYLLLGFTCMYVYQFTSGCDLEPIYGNVGDTVEFQYNTVSTVGTITYEVLRGSDSPKIRLRYLSGTPDPVQENTDITFTGNAVNGDISFEFANVQQSDNGTYVLKNTVPQDLECIVLHIYGKPTVSVRKGDDPAVGGSIVFTCDATSTTVPSPVSAKFTFSWTFGLLTNPTGERFTYNGSQFGISKVSPEDNGEAVTCMATELPNGISSDWSNSVNFTATEECCCCCIYCFIVLIVAGALGFLFTGGHIGLTWTDHEHSVKKIRRENNDTNTTTEAVCLKDFGIKAVLPKCCICLVVIIVQIAVYFAALQKDCNEDEHCVNCCNDFICLGVTIIVSVVKDATESGIIYLVVHVKGRNYIHQGQPVATNIGQVNSNDTELCKSIRSG